MIGVLGGGAWGTALAVVALRAGNKVRLWLRDPGQAQSIRQSRENRLRLPGVCVPAPIEVTDDVAAVRHCEPLLLGVPAQAVRDVLLALGPVERTLIICAKGLERATGKRLSEVAVEVAPLARVAVLSGPSFAREVVEGVPTAVTLAAETAEEARDLVQMLATQSFRPYPSDDLIGVELGGALKNVTAIAAGIAMGRGFGENARAALITRSLAELTRLGGALGARRETLTGLSGLGDLVLTASSLTSRNTRFGYEFAQGRSLADLTSRGAALAEGSWTAQAAVDLARTVRIDLPICEAVAAVLRGDTTIDEAVDALLARPIPVTE